MLVVGSSVANQQVTKEGRLALKVGSKESGFLV
jgi:hypothetical protein